jgi:multiple sugar transport system permease protein
VDGGVVRARSARKTAAAFPFISLWVIGFVVFIALPIVLVLYWSFTDYNLFSAPQWVGLANYQTLIADPIFWKSVWNTAYLALLGIPAGLVMGLGTAILLNRPMTGRGFYRAVVFMPGIVPPVVGALVFVWILNPNYGLLNAILALFGIRPVGWLSDPSWAKIAELMMVLWGSVGMTMVVFLAGLKEIPDHLYEAAAIDGASAWAKFRYITLPMLSPVIFYNIIVGVIFYLQFFEQAFVITSQDIGAPVNSTLFFSLYLYQNAFLFLKMGTASAMAWVLFVATVGITALFFGLQRRFVFYLGED